jgi:uncharacterized protein YjbI with pentapeptide repeats
MKSLFRFSPREPSGSLREREEANTLKPGDRPGEVSSQLPLDRPRNTTTSVQTVDVPEGLIPSSELPSATDILENLFRAEEVGQKEAVANQKSPIVPAANERQVSRPAEEDRVRELVHEEIGAGRIALAAPPPTDAKPTGGTPPTLEAKLSADAESPAELQTLSIELAERALEQAGSEENISPAVNSAGTQAASASDPASRAISVASDWGFEETLACHREWVESHGTAGRRADLSGFNLQHADLISVNLRHADLRDANLESADLLLADLRDSCLVRANLNECCLVGANLEGANLEGATLDSAMGLVASQIAGANLREASLPEHTSEFPARLAFQRNSQMAARFFTAMMVVMAASGLMIWKTKDLQLLGNLSILPFLHSAGAAAALPTAQIYLIAPVVLFILYLVFHFHLQALWDTVLQLPGIFPDGRELGQDAPRIVRGLLRAHFRWMNREAASTRLIERALALLLAYWGTPLTLSLFWARYLTLQNLHGTMLHALLLVVAFGVALYSTTKIGRPLERWTLETKHQWKWVSKLREINAFGVSLGLAAVLLFLTIGVTEGAPHGRSRAPQFGPNNIRRWAATVFWSAGYDPYADLTEAWLSRAPAHWAGADQDISSVRGANLIDTSFRYAQAYGVFLVNAHLWHTDFEGAFLSDADLRGADLGQSTLRYAILDRARLYHVNLDRSNLDGANLNRADLREANLSYCSLLGAILIDAQLQGASLYGARLSGSTAERANFEKTDLRSAYIDGARLDHANLTQAYLWSAKMTAADLRGAQLASAIFIDANLQDGDLRGAQFVGTVLSGANLAGADIDGADLRGALGLTAAQVCSTKSRQGAVLAESLAGEVQGACGGPLLAAPRSAAVATPEAPTPGAKSGRTGKP